MALRKRYLWVCPSCNGFARLFNKLTYKIKTLIMCGYCKKISTIEEGVTKDD